MDEQRPISQSVVSQEPVQILPVPPKHFGTKTMKQFFKDFFLVLLIIAVATAIAAYFEILARYLFTTLLVLAIGPAFIFIVIRWKKNRIFSWGAFSAGLFACVVFSWWIWLIVHISW